MLLWIMQRCKNFHWLKFVHRYVLWHKVKMSPLVTTVSFSLNFCYLPCLLKVPWEEEHHLSPQVTLGVEEVAEIQDQ